MKKIICAEPPDVPRSLQLWGAGSRWVRVRWRAPPAPRTHFAALYTPLHALPARDHSAHHHNLTLDPTDGDRYCHSLQFNAFVFP